MFFSNRAIFLSARRLEVVCIGNAQLHPIFDDLICLVVQQFITLKEVFSIFNVNGLALATQATAQHHLSMSVKWNSTPLATEKHNRRNK